MPNRSRKWRGQQPLPRRRADQRERGQIDPHRARRRAFADHDIERAVLHRGIEDFLDRGTEPVDFVNEQDVAVLQIGEQRREIARFGNDRAGCGAEPDAHFLGDNLRERGLAKPRRAKEQHMVKRLPAPLRGLDEHAQIIARAACPINSSSVFGRSAASTSSGALVGGGEAVVSHVRRRSSADLSSMAIGVLGNRMMLGTQIENGLKECRNGGHLQTVLQPNCGHYCVDHQVACWRITDLQ